MDDIPIMDNRHKMVEIVDEEVFLCLCELDTLLRTSPFAELVDDENFVLGYLSHIGY